MLSVTYPSGKTSSGFPSHFCHYYDWKGWLMRSSAGYNNHIPTQILQIHCTCVSSWLRRANSCLFSSLSIASIWDTVEVRSLLYLTFTSSSERKIYIYIYIYNRSTISKTYWPRAYTHKHIHSINLMMSANKDLILCRYIIITSSKTY